VKEICDGISPDLYDDLFEKHFREGHGEVFLISKEVTRSILPRSDHSYGRWEYLESDSFLKRGYISRSEQVVKRSTPELSILRSLLASATQENPHVLIVEDIDRTGVQILGMLFDIDPHFIAQHLGEEQSRHNISHESPLGVLSDKFKNLLEERNEVPSHAEADVDMASNPSPSYTMFGRLFRSITIDQAKALALWPGSGTGRMNSMFKHVVLRPRASCYQVSPYGCKFLSFCVGCLLRANLRR
jgi:hypothetical protein